jgi:hypothetical protein
MYSMIKIRVLIENFVGLTMKPTSKSILALLKLEFTKMNLSTIKILRKRKEKLPYFFHPDVSSPACKPTTYKYSLP